MSDDGHLTKLDGPRSLADPALTPEVWVDRYCSIYRVTYRYKTNSFLENGEPLDASMLLSQMRLLAHNLEVDHLKALLPDAISVWRREEERAFLSGLKDRLSHRVIERDWVAEWTEAVAGKRDTLDIAVMRHFIWQVRRKLYGLSVDHHTMPILVGRSGGGKSVAMHVLLAPLSEVTIGRDLTVFNDPFGRRQFNRNYVMVFDELGKSHQADVNSLKNIVTATEISWRGMNSESTHSAKQNCTFMGASNHPVRERIQDPTSARRFWQLNCAPKLDWERINSIDYLALWKSIDERGPCPILAVLEQVRAIQDREIRTRDLMEQWMELAVEPAGFSESSPTTDELYGWFRKWCMAQRFSAYPSAQAFARGLQERIDRLNWGITSKHTHCGTTWPLGMKREVVA